MARKQGSHSDITGPRVRAAALDLFAREGFAAVSMRRLAAEVGLQAGALYAYADGKESLLHLLIREHLAGRLDAWKALTPPAAPAARLEAFVLHHLRHRLAHPAAADLAAREARELAGEAGAEVRALEAEYLAALETVLAEGAAAGAFQLPDIGLAGRAVLALVDGIATSGATERLPAARIERIAWNMVRRAVGA